MTFAETVAAAIREFTERGYQSEAQLNEWLERLKEAAERAATSRARMERMLNEALRAVYTKLVEKQAILKRHPGVGRFTLEKVNPQLRLELDRRILASANLIKLDRQNAIDNTLRRFSGWATSIPTGGSGTTSKREAAEGIKKAMRSLPFQVRRVLTDQGHKLNAALSDIIATDGGAIAARWRHHHVRYPRKVHVERDGEVFVIRSSWAHAKGFVRRGENGYTDEIEQPGQLVFCRCTYEYLYNLRQLPPELITKAGQQALEAARAALGSRKAA